MRYLLPFAVLSLSVGLVFGGQEESLRISPVVVTATRYEIPIQYLSEPVQMITSREIAAWNPQSLFDTLRLANGFSLKRTGGPGQWTTLRFRGGASKHLLLLINGVRVSDPSTPSDDFGQFFSYFDPSDIERIEVVGGSQGALYGSDAVSGVLNVITRSPAGKPSFSFGAEGGSLGRVKTLARAKGNYGDLGYFLSLSGERTGGVLEHEEFKNKTLSSNLSYKLSMGSRISLFTRFSDSFVNYSHWCGRKFKAYDDPRAYKYTKWSLFSLGFEGKPTRSLDYDLKLSFNRTRRKYEDLDDGVLDAKDNVKDYPLDKHYKGTNLTANAQAVLKPIEELRAILGFDFLSQQAESDFDGELWNASPYLTCHAILMDGSTILNIGSRLDNHSIFGQNLTYKFGAAYLLKGLGMKLRGSFGTGFKAPSLYQMLSPLYGNRELKPEKSIGVNVGIEGRFWENRLAINIDLFKNNFKDIITFESLFDEKGKWIGGRYVNREKAESKGIELSLLAAPVRSLRLGVGYTYTEGKEGDEPLSLVPKHSLNLRSIFSHGKFSGGIYIFKVGERFAYDHKHKIRPYTRVDLSGSYRLPKGFDLFLKVENLLNVNYEEAAGYKVPGLCAFGGIKLSI
ncbi:TPA: TonB-dependent receptor [Candidatus Poribacteria bacterium]|nr:TonB-dependent receptor [Candidatus Poribacteria bacterium]HEX28751.1 TonB-dependent receptor [Candidatus Poribacteria bacterium]